MGFPIAYGAKTVSSRPIAFLPEPVEDYADDGVVLLPSLNSSCQQPLIAMGINSSQELMALVTITYYDMIREDETESVLAYTVAEVHIQISPLALPFSSNYRETVHRIVLPHSTTTSSNKNETMFETTIQRGTSMKKPSVVFSSDGRHLACLVPYPSQRQSHERGCMPFRSTVVIFQLRKPRSQSTTTPPPVRPSYINSQSESPGSFILVPVATHPSLVHGSRVLDILPQKGERIHHDHVDDDEREHSGDDQYLLYGTSLCDVSMSKDRTERAGSVLLAGCSDGSIFVIGYRTGRVAGKLVSPDSEPDLSEEEGDSIDYMTHLTTSSHPTNPTTHKDGASKGRLLAIRSNGRASIYESHLDITIAGGISTESQTVAQHPISTQNSMAKQERVPDVNGFASTNISTTEENSNDEGTDEHSALTPKSNGNHLPSPALPPPIQRRQVSQSTTVGDASQNHQQQRQLLMHLDPLTELEGPFAAATWINGFLLATLPDPFYFASNQGDRSKAHVWAIPNVGNDQQMDPIMKQPLSCLEMTDSRLKETAHVMFHFEMLGKGETSVETIWSNSLAIHYDESSGCLAISSVVLDCGDSTP
jgi:hypothetical protein